MSKRSRIYSPRRGTSIPSTARNEAVERIYRDKDGGLPDFTRLDRRSSFRRRWLIGGGLVTLALLAVAAWTSFLVFKPYAASSGGNVVVTVDAPATAAVGAEITYRIRVLNDDRIPIANAVLEFKPPRDFALIASEPVPDDARAIRWLLGNLAGRGMRTVEVRGRLYGIPDTEARAEAMAIYRPANFNADFQAIAAAITKFDVSPVGLTVAGPTEAIPGETVAYTVTYENTGTAATPPLVVLLDPPRAFALTDAKPERPRKEELLWRIGELAPQTKGSIVITGAFGNDAKGSLDVRATVAIEPAPDRRLLQSEQVFATAVLGGDVVLIATVNDQSQGIDARPGDALRFRVAVRNDGQTELRGLTVRAVFNAAAAGEKSILDFNKLEDPLNGAVVGEQVSPQIRRGTITWSTKEVPDLASLKPGEQRLFSFNLPLRPTDTIVYPANAQATLVASVDVNATGTIEKPRTVTAAPLVIKVRAS